MNLLSNYSYYDIAMNDFKYLQFAIEMKDKDFYNRNAILCEQVVEKLLKHIVQNFCFKEDYTGLLKGHNLVKLYKAIVDEEIEIKISKNMLRTLKDYYFDANYPGDNFILVDEDELNEAYEFTKEVVEKVFKFLDNKKN